jgi:multicomponent Na+:H+ antiporter subunit C
MEQFATVMPLFSTALLLLGLWGVATRKNLIKIFISLAVAETGVNLLFISLTDFSGKMAPIITDALVTTGFTDPLPQALILTSIVIGTAVTALGLALTARYYERTGNLNITKMKELKN